MGVDIATWVKVIRAHPAKWKFEGLGDSREGYFFESVGDAAAHDKDFMESWMEGEAEGEADYLRDLLNVFRAAPTEEPDEWMVEQYIQRLRDDNGETGDPEDEDYLDAVALLDKYDDKDERELFCGSVQDYDDCSLQWEFLRSGDYDEELLEEHPPIEMLSHASGDGVPIEEIVFICPSCGREPQGESGIDIANGRFYCGLCGGEATVGYDLDFALRDALRQNGFGENVVGLVNVLRPDILADARTLVSLIVNTFDHITLDEARSVWDQAVLAKEFGDSLFSFFEALEINLYPFAPEKRRALLERAQKYAPHFEVPSYWEEQWATLLK